jgi:hypothetical protein
MTTYESNHEVLIHSSQVWMGHFNFILSLTLWSDSEREIFQDDFNYNKIYDV